MGPVAERWAKKAASDLEAAKEMLHAEQFDYVLFCCQQSLEKMLKALIIERTGEMAPRIHNLIRLSSDAGIELSHDAAQLFRDLSGWYVVSRYPDDVDFPETDQKRASSVLEKTLEVFEWLSSTP